MNRKWPQWTENEKAVRLTKSSFGRLLHSLLTRLDHRFPTFFEAGTPFIKIRWRSHPNVSKKRRNNKNSPILRYSHFEITNRNAYRQWQHNRKYSVAPCCPLQTNLVTFLLPLIWNYPLIPWHTITQSHAQIFREFKRFRYLFSNEVARKIQICKNMLLQRPLK